MGLNSILFTVHGKVQGVGFRWSTKSFADKLGIKGYVKNRSDGTVEVLAIGSDIQINEISEFLSKGTPFSRVEYVEESQVEVSENCYNRFVIE